ncbi:hypothetical protein QYE76_013653 [Lolium multiflorum]|uniref:DUF4283 domain-containing protein n=1 Tax=Lolium multiflorum TaxID=4521 RepID=A0AAD8U147_LOLMU|nr:hypothetical protein QYE76_013653 [Lolium multiflorum]
MASKAGKGKAKGKEVEVEGVEGMLKKLQIAERRKVVTLGRPSASKKANPNQVVGKVLSEKLAHAVGIQDTLGKIWCPREGTICKELRRNVFLITFKQESGKRRALEGGPWLAGKDLLVLEDFVENKTLDEYEFRFFQMWVRVSNLPLGRMNRETGEQIGNAMGESVEVDVDEGGFAIGEFLRVRVKLDVREPIMRGIRVRLEEDEEEMGGRGKQYGEVEGDEEEGREEEEEAGSGPSKWCTFTYDDSESWRNKDENFGGKGKDKPVEEKEVTSPLKLPQPAEKPKTTSQKVLVFEEADMLIDGAGNDGAVHKPAGVVVVANGKGEQELVEGGERERLVEVKVQAAGSCSTMVGDMTSRKAQQTGVVKVLEKPAAVGKTFKRRNNGRGKIKPSNINTKTAGKKRDVYAMEVDGLVAEEKTKRLKGLELDVEKVVETNLDAGLQFQPCRDQ